MQRLCGTRRDEWCAHVVRWEDVIAPRSRLWRPSTRPANPPFSSSSRQRERVVVRSALSYRWACVAVSLAATLVASVTDAAAQEQPASTGRPRQAAPPAPPSSTPSLGNNP